MGTSVNQSSPKTGGWRIVSACYSDNRVPVERLATELWRAASHQDKTVFEQLGSKFVETCLREAERPQTTEAAVKRIDRLNALKGNNLLGEFAKRAFLIKAAGGFPNESPTSVLFRQISDYFVSRDIPGRVGPGWRCKTIGDVRKLKSDLGNAVARKVAAIEKQERLVNRSWQDRYKLVLKGLQAA